jgi:uncharacterized protein (TIGR02145 family)
MLNRYRMKASASSGDRTRDYQRCNHIITLPVIITFVSVFLVSCGNAKRNNNSPSAHIAEITIGNQVWMARNFDGVVFRNGDSIPHVTSTEEWEKAGKEKRPAWCYYENDTSIGRKYGRIYNWYAINDARGFSPDGWHVPTNDELITLENFVGSSEAGLRLKCNAGSNKNGIGNNSSKFCLLLGGYRGKEGGFSGVEEFTYLVSSTERDPKENDVWGRGIHYADSTIMRCGLFKEHGLYVRLIKD